MSGISVWVNVLLQMMPLCLHSKLTNDRANEGKNAKQNSRRAKVSDQGTVYRLRGHFVPASADDAFYCSEKKIYISLSHFVYRCVVIVSKTEEEKRKNPDWTNLVTDQLLTDLFIAWLRSLVVVCNRPNKAQMFPLRQPKLFFISFFSSCHTRKQFSFFPPRNGLLMTGWG